MREILIQLFIASFNVNIIRICALTADKSKQGLEDWYQDLEILKITKKHEVNLKIGDFSAKISRGRVTDLLREHGLGDKNDLVDRLKDEGRGSVKITQHFEEILTGITNETVKQSPKAEKNGARLKSQKIPKNGYKYKRMHQVASRSI